MTQAEGMDILKMGNNVFLTGSAGSGKTYVLNAYIKYLREHAIDVAVTASTGIAATHMGGMTIHAWSGIGIRDYLSDYDIDRMEEKKYLWDRFEKVKVLVIDEISMLSGTFLDNLDRLCRSMKRKDDLPFGGIQVILCGDLFQLPPISRGDAPADFVVHANAWKTIGLAMCYLTEQHRQEDNAFLDILNAIRANSLDSYHFETLESRIKEYDEEDFQNITKLFTHNADVDTINDRQLASIDSDEQVFRMTDKGKSNLVENLKKSCLAPEVLKLKIGAEVMFVKNNFDKGYVNGTRGTIIDFDSELDLPIVKTLEGETITVDNETWSIEDEGKILASITQLPLRHAWAITIHKSQGMSLDSAVIDLSRSFAYGMGYVALSRVRTLNGVHLLGLSSQALLVDPIILSIDQQLQKLSDRASARLSEISPDELKLVHDDFITKSGGTLVAQKLTKKELKKGSLSTQKTHQTTYDLIRSGKTIAEVARERDLTFGTIVNHLEKCKELDMVINFSHINVISNEDLEIIGDAFDNSEISKTDSGQTKLSPIKTYLDRAGYAFSFDVLRLAKLLLNK
jgi:hypothetical protein